MHFLFPSFEICFSFFLSLIFFLIEHYNPVLSKSVNTISLRAFAHFVSLCHMLVILTISQTFLLLYLLWLSVIKDH